MHSSQKAKAEIFRDLHHRERMLVLPNTWDPLGAALLSNLGYPAIATASASVAYSNGYRDGENIPFADLLSLLEKIVRMVNLPVSADIESGFATTNAQLEKNIASLIDTGIVGINLEDTDKMTNNLLPVETQCARISLVKKIAAQKGIPLFVNARTDVYLKGELLSEEEKYRETEKRGQAYKHAGADCFFPILMSRKNDICNLIKKINYPVNIIAIAGIPDLKALNNIGVARVSLGPGFLKIAIKAMKDIAEKLKNYEGLEEITGNGITSDFLKKLIGA